MKDDLISRQATMKEFSNFVRRSNNSDFARTPTWNDAVSLVGSMPSAEPERCEDCGNFNKTMLLIPQTDIIRCKDCKYSDTFPENADNDMPLKCLGIRYGGVFPDWYCEHAERRKENDDGGCHVGDAVDWCIFGRELKNAIYELFGEDSQQ